MSDWKNDEELIAAAMREQQGWKEPFPLAIGKGELVCLISAVQLACRHPNHKGDASDIARQIVRTLTMVAYENDPATRELISRGWDPAHDCPPEDMKLPPFNGLRIPDEAGNLGKLDSEAESLAKRLNADGVVLAVCGGDNGSGFTVTARSMGAFRAMAKAVRQVADKMDAQYGSL